MQKLLGVDDSLMLGLIETHIPELAYTVETILERLEINRQQLSECLKDIANFEQVLTLNDQFRPRQRLVHVITEHMRVQEFKRVCSTLTPK